MLLTNHLCFPENYWSSDFAISSSALWETGLVLMDSEAKERSNLSKFYNA